MAKDALRNGYTAIGRRPRSAAPGCLMSEEDARRFDEVSDSMSKWGGRDARLHRRFQDKPQDTIIPEDEDNGSGFY